MSKAAETLQAAIAPLFPATAVVCVAQIDAAVSGLLPQEAAQIARAVEKRQAEFAAGRRAARAALAQLNAPLAPLLKGEDRAPIWPRGYCGSISHSKEFAVAVVAKAQDVRGLGIDLEKAEPLKEELWKKILTVHELHSLQILPNAEQALLGMQVFCAKEAAYKAQYPLSKKVFGFDGLSISAPDDLSNFAASFTRDIPPFSTGEQLHGKVICAAGQYVAAVSL